MTEAEMAQALLPLLQERKALVEYARYEDVYGSALYDGSAAHLLAFDRQHPAIAMLHGAVNHWDR